MKEFHLGNFFILELCQHEQMMKMIYPELVKLIKHNYFIYIGTTFFAIPFQCMEK